MTRIANWPTRAMYVVVALALVLGLTLTAAPAPVDAGPADPGYFEIYGGDYTIYDDGTMAGYFTGYDYDSIEEGPYYVEAYFRVDVWDPAGAYQGYWDGSFWAQAWISENRIDFEGEWDGPLFSVALTVVGGEFYIGSDGWFELWYDAYDGQGFWYEFYKQGYIGIPQIEPGYSLDVKGATQKFILVNVPYYDTPLRGQHVGLMEPDFEWMIDYDGLAQALQEVQSWYCPAVVGNESWNPYPVVNPDNVPLEIMDGGQAGDGWIKLRMTKPGDCRVEVTLSWIGPGGGPIDIIVGDGGTVEKKWGVIDHTILDLNPPDPIQIPPTHNNHVSFQAYQGRTLHDWVYTWYHVTEGKQVGRAGHAIVHWWLIEDTTTTRAEINQIMDDLGRHATIDDTAVGTWTYDEPPFELTPEQRIDAVWNLNQAYYTEFTNTPDGFYYLENDWTYMKTVTQDSFPGEWRGLSAVEVDNWGEENIMVVTLVEYPYEYHGENPVCIEMGTIEWTYEELPEIVDVKVPQVRWAGEKIVLEKNWGIDNPWDYFAVYSLELGSVGNLEAIDAVDALYWQTTAQQVLVALDGDGISRTILVSEQQGKADVNVALYPYPYAYGMELTANHGFMVFFLAFEDIVLADTDHGALIDVTKEADLTRPVPGEDIPVAFQVRGWFTSAALPLAIDPDTGQVRAEKNGLPRGRYVLPDDWAQLAGPSYKLRPYWDLMDQAHEDDIISAYPLGPFYDDTDPNDLLPWTTDPPGVAEYPTIGPFSTLQEWSVEDKWVAVAETVRTSLWTERWRNTVVPDGEITWHDCPMPQALIIFDIAAYNTVAETPSLSGLEKWGLEGYGYLIDISGTATGGTATTVQDTTRAWTGGELAGRMAVVHDTKVWITANTATGFTFTPALPSSVASGDAYYITVFPSPFYAAEIPAHAQLPAGPPGYNWDSWGMDWPYGFWWDLEIDSITADTREDPVDAWDVEAYSDNHGIIGVTVDALQQVGSVTIGATAEYPYAPKKGQYVPIVSEEITVVWGPQELNPHFVPDKTTVEVGEMVTFTNLTTGGTTPYVEAEWDFGDGTPPLVVRGTPAQVMDDVTHAYAEEGAYFVTLTMTDSTPMTRTEVRKDPIIVGEPPVVLPDEPTTDVGFASIIDELGMVYFWDVPTQTWLFYWPEFAEFEGYDQIGTLTVGEVYWVYITSPCTLNYGTYSKNLVVGWQFIVWPAQ